MALLEYIHEPMQPQAPARLGPSKAASTETQLTPANGAPNDSIRRVALTGWLIIAIFFGGLGTWALTAPLNGAVVANAVVKVDGNRKSVQHLDGGIVKELRVREGERVLVGDILIVLDETQAQAEYDVLSQEYVVLRATEARLMAELNHAAELAMPPDLNARAEASYVKGVWNGQVSQFDTRRAALDGQRSVIREKINQLGSQIVGSEAQVKAFTDQIDSVKAEAKSIAPLVDGGLIARPRILQLAVNFQEVVHSTPAVNADVAKQTVIRGGPNGHSQECASDAQRSRCHGAERC
jgi:membrane fusion protein, type I secretion system